MEFLLVFYFLLNSEGMLFSAGVKLILFTVATVRKCFGFMLNTGLIIQGEGSFYYLHRAKAFLCFPYCHIGEGSGDV